MLHADIVSTDLQQGCFLDPSEIVYFFGSAGFLFRFHMVEYPFGYTNAAVTGQRYKIPLFANAGLGKRRSPCYVGNQIQLAEG